MAVSVSLKMAPANVPERVAPGTSSVPVVLVTTASSCELNQTVQSGEGGTSVVLTYHELLKKDLVMSVNL